MFHCGDCLNVMRGMSDGSVDLVMCSPPYEDCRMYGELEFKLSGDAWVQWAADRYMECLRVCRGLVAWVVEGKTRKYRYSATPPMLMVELAKRGAVLRKPPVFHRVGIPGSGGPDWWRNDWEWIICATRTRGKLPWSDNTACGHPPKFPPGGNPSHQSRDGRVYHPRPQREGNVRRVRTYEPPALANPGNVIHLNGGGGHMGHKLAHENEAPFPLALAERFVKSFCPPGGIVLDPFGGSGTTAHAAVINGRRAVYIDARKSQVEIARARLAEVSGVGAEGGAS